MNIDIQAEAIEPRRQTFSYLARRFGADRPASRYEEATFDVQPTTNFHYRPLYAPEFEIFDPRRTRIAMRDWYVFKDPRQLYYATYNISRAAMQAAFDSKLAFVEKSALLDMVEPGWREIMAQALLPMRHYEWGANMNCQAIVDQGYGTQITSAAAFCGADRLGLSQVVSRIGLLFDGGTGTALDRARQEWIEAPHWQDLRRLVEDSFVVPDWFELFVAQLLAMDGIAHPLVFQAFDAAGRSRGGAALSLLTEFGREWYDDNARWVDAVVKAAAAESDDNRALLSGWFRTWAARAAHALRPVSALALGAADGAAEIARIADALNARAKKLGLEP